MDYLKEKADFRISNSLVNFFIHINYQLKNMDVVKIVKIDNFKGSIFIR